MKATTLYQGVAVYELVQRLELASPRHLTLRHLRLVLGLPEPQQRRLLTKAEADAWSIDMLEVEAQKQRGDSRGGGRPALPSVLKVLRGWRRVSGAGDFEKLGDIAKLKPEELAEARKAVADMQRQLGVLAGRLDGFRE